MIYLQNSMYSRKRSRNISGKKDDDERVFDNKKRSIKHYSEEYLSFG